MLPRLPLRAQLPLLAPDASTATPTAAAGSPEAQQALHCRIFLTAFLLLVGGVAPTLLLAKLLVPMEAAAAAARGSRQQPAAASAAGAGEQRGGPLKRAGSRCLGWLRRAAEVGEAAGLHLCRILLNAVGSPLLTCMAWWVMASLVWVTALVLEQPHLALGLPGSACAAPGSGAS